ncbi:MAG: hypothetical protein KDK55_00630 [Chlamydiia bacterium]|nr:hypothetical protein [Chlamydiia bacterium]
MTQEIINDLQEVRMLVDSLLKTKHYQRLGAEGIFAIIQKAKATNVNPLDALNGGMYYVQGKVEMSAFLMNQLIRQAGHSISKDEKSNDTECILHGKRADTGDAWTETFSINDAKRAGIYLEGTGWTKYPRNMLFARALSNLGRMLFPDVIKGCYVEGEIENPSYNMRGGHQEVEQSLKSDPQLKKRLLQFFGVSNIEEIPQSQWGRISKIVTAKGEQHALS